MVLASLATETAFFGVISLWLLAIIPAAIVTALKGRWLLFVAGWVSFGAAWFFGAIPRDRPVRWLGAALALILALGAFGARPSPILGVSGKPLQFSVDGGFILGTPSDSCTPLGPGTWRCQAWDSQHSSDIDYRVRMHRLGCWTATRIDDYGGEGGSPKRFSGCITILDHLSI